MSTRAGDVVIWHVSDASTRQVAIVYTDNEQPQNFGTRWRVMGGQDAEAYAAHFVEETGGRIHDWYGYGEPIPRQVPT